MAKLHKPHGAVSERFMRHHYGAAKGAPTSAGSPASPADPARDAQASASGSDAMNAANYWQEEARRYAQNADYWRQRAETAEIDAALDLRAALAAVIRKARDGLAAGSRSMSNSDFEIEYGGALIDSIEEGIDAALAAKPAR